MAAWSIAPTVGLGVADRRLVDEADLLVEAAELALDDLLDHLRRLAGVLHLRAVDRALALEHVGRDVLAADVLRVGGGHLQRQLRSRVWKSSVRATKSDSQLSSTSTPILPPMWMYEPIRPSLVERPDFLRGLREPALAQDGRGLLDVAVGLLQRGLALHHAGAGAVAERLDQGCGNFDCHKVLLQDN